MAQLPKFLLCPAELNRKRQDFIVHTLPPRMIGKVVQDGAVYHVLLCDLIDNAPVEAVAKVCKDMKDWYYFKHVAQPQS